MRPASTFFEISRLYISFQDIFERRNVHFLPCQAVHAVRDRYIPYIVFWEKDFDITARFNIVPPKP